MTTENQFRLLPALDDHNRHFWTGGREGELRMLRCAACRAWVHPPAPRCPDCLATQLAPEATTGRGRVHSFTVNHQPWNPLIPVPYIVALVELDDQPGLRLMTNIVGCEPDEVLIDHPVDVGFEDYGEVHVPVFRLRDPS